MTSPTRQLWAKGTEALARDPVFGPWVRRAGPVQVPAVSDAMFPYLVRSIVYQQLAGAAAATIHGRVIEALDGVVEPATVLATDPAALRGAGLSGAKLKAIVDLSQKVSEGVVRLGARELEALDDDEVVAHLTQVWGVGRWTVEMFLMFRLARPDVWPVGDLGVRGGWARIHRLDDRPSARDLAGAADHLGPWRSAVAWYCWRALEIPDTEIPT